MAVGSGSGCASMRPDVRGDAAVPTKAEWSSRASSHWGQDRVEDEDGRACQCVGRVAFCWLSVEGDAQIGRQRVTLLGEDCSATRRGLPRHHKGASSCSSVTGAECSSCQPTRSCSQSGVRREVRLRPRRIDATESALVARCPSVGRAATNRHLPGPADSGDAGCSVCWSTGWW